MTDANVPRSDEADPDKMTTPAGIANELEEMAAERDTTTMEPDDPR